MRGRGVSPETFIEKCRSVPDEDYSPMFKSGIDEMKNETDLNIDK